MTKIGDEINEIADMSLVRWNDRPSRTFDEVKALVERLAV
jgi:hypothetical protein